MRRINYIFHRVILKPLLKLYLRADRRVSYDGFRLLVKRGVFHPLLYFSTKFLYGFLKEKDLTEKKFLEVGCGSGLLSLLAYKKGAAVSAIDVDQRAVDATKFNFDKNFPGHRARIFKSDVFAQVPEEIFDVIVINPPYYFKEVKHPDQQAWYCGEDGEYFKKLFSGLESRMQVETDVFMVLEENCELKRISELADEYQLKLNLIREKTIRWEKSMIFKITGRY